MATSMTAFARCQSSTDWGQLAWEIKTVNHRYLDISARIPDALKAIENTLRETVSKHLARGKVECTLRYQLNTRAPSNLQVDEQLVDRITELARKIEIRMHESSGLSVADVLAWPGVVRESEIDTEPLLEAAQQLLEETLAELVVNRQREGQRLQQMIEQRLDAISEHLASLREIIPQLVPDYRSRLRERLAEVIEDLDPARLEQELLIFANKADISEEVDRLQAHIDETRDVLSSRKAIGRRLDFLMQEMNREANTLGSKAMDIRITNTSVELKVLIEQMREQIQNIE